MGHDILFTKHSKAPVTTLAVKDRVLTHNPLGAKGCGESGAIGAPAAVVSALLDALSPLGVTDLEMPATPLRVWQLLNALSPR